jgi:hypothetical protein
MMRARQAIVASWGKVVVKHWTMQMALIVGVRFWRAVLITEDAFLLSTCYQLAVLWEAEDRWAVLLYERLLSSWQPMVAGRLAAVANVNPAGLF